MAYILFYLSGFASLVYQVIWTRQLALLFGSTVQSAATTVAAFLCGLGLGARLATVLLRKGYKPGRLFACLELAVAVFSLFLAWAIPQGAGIAGFLSTLFGGGAALSCARFVSVFLLLCLPCMAMGATLPVLTEYVAQDRKSDFGPSLATLYAINTLGAASGAIIADYYLIRWLGVFGTAAVGSTLDLGVGLVGFFTLGSIVRSDVRQDQTDSSPNSFSQDGLLLFLTGYCGLCLEILWVRVLVFYNGSDVYAFSSVVATFLLGLMLGSLWSRRLLKRPGRLLVTALLAGLAGAILLSLAASLAIPQMRAYMKPIFNMGHSFEFVRFVTDAFLMLPTTVLLGALFPILCHRVLLNSSDQGMSPAYAVGRAYLWNTGGSLLGSLTAGFLILPLLGMQGGLQFVALVAAIALLVELRNQWTTLRKSTWAWGLIGYAVVLIGVSLSLPRNFLIRSLFGSSYENTIFWGEDPYGTIALSPKYSEFENRDTEDLIVDGFNMMGNSIWAKRYAASLAAIPILLHPQPNDVLVIAFGLGNTLSTAVGMKETKTVDCVELSSMVVQASGHLDYVKQTLASPKLHVIFSDGRNYVGTTKKQYDIITAEPPPPIHAGIVNLYSREYFRECRRCLKPGGILTHWLPVNQMSDFEARTVIRACQEVFPYTTLWEGAQLNLVLVASAKPIHCKASDFDARFESNRELLASHYLDGPELMLASCLRLPEELAKYCASTPPLTDDHPYLQHYQGAWNPDYKFFFLAPTGFPIEEPIDGPRYARAKDELNEQNILLLGGQADPVQAQLATWDIGCRLLDNRPQSLYIAYLTRTEPRALEGLWKKVRGPEGPAREEATFQVFGALLATRQLQAAREFLQGEFASKWPEPLKEQARALIERRATTAK